MRLTFVGFGPKVQRCATAEAEAFYAANVGGSLTPPLSPRQSLGSPPELDAPWPAQEGEWRPARDRTAG